MYVVKPLMLRMCRYSSTCPSVLALQIVSTLAMSTASRIIKEKQLPAHFVSV